MSQSNSKKPNIVERWSKEPVDSGFAVMKKPATKSVPKKKSKK